MKRSRKTEAFPYKTTAAAVRYPVAAARSFPWLLAMLPVTLFQLLSFASVLLRTAEQEPPEPGLLLAFLCYLPAEWLFLCCLRFFAGQRSLAPEVMALWLTGISIALCGSISAEYAWKQAAAAGGGMLLYAILLFVTHNPDRAMALRPAVAFGAVALLAGNLALAQITNGTRNWIHIGGFSLQPSELVKLAFIFVGAATLERLQRTRSITRYLVFAMVCVAALFLMRDFGAALLFFVVFLLIAFLRSGDLRAIALVCAAALMAAALVLLFRPYVVDRFRSFRHIWETPYGKGFQQTRMLIYASGGGLLGLGPGNGKLKDVPAASTDLAFGMLCEEWGMVIAFLVPLCYLGMAIYALRGARGARSSFYSIAAVSAAGLLLFQAALNIFGSTDLLPMTGVTLPFISRGGSSMLCVWGLLAFMKPR
ncbi:MAG: FtsW/RodA/SpoVE family cell cycle protein [Oscillospiraceae bacterium]|jgi:cell division protein FtsW (lipid II flippase)|nr:FtsW/RodA/SpoVE family cell cycle protein [Oscillospiraceae bacterium]